MLVLLQALQEYPAITTKEFYKRKASKQSFVCIFFAPWCGHCQAFRPEYEAAKKKLTGLVDLVAINCDAEENKQLCGEQGVKGFPTVKMFNHNGKERKAIDYQGPRTSADLIRWVAAHHRKPFKTATDFQKIEEAVADLQEYIVITTAAQKPVSMIYKVARKFSKIPVFVNLEFAEVPSSESPAGKLLQEGTNVIYCQPTGCLRFDGPETTYEAVKAWVSGLKPEL